MRRCFADSGYWIALLNERDEFHARASELAIALDREHGRTITTDAVLFEVGAFFHEYRGEPRRAVAEALDAIGVSAHIDVLYTGVDTMREAVGLYGRCLDKQWSLADCLSFVVMRRQGISEALSADAHFAQAGFRPLLGAEADGPAR